MTTIAAMLLPSMAVFAQSDSLRISPDSLRPSASTPMLRDIDAGGETECSLPTTAARRTPLLSRKGVQLFEFAVPMAAIGLAVAPADKSFRRLWLDEARPLRNDIDNWTQYAPAALMLGLKACGVEGRSSWGRMLTADAVSVATMAVMVNAIKYTVGRERPDGSSNNSFPSGHTATAFMCATMLHKEYGLTRSAWYSVAGYTVATATAFSRQVNNRHWMSDTMTGAAIGVFSAELGYFVADLLFKERGIRRPDRLVAPLDIADTRFYIGVDLGASFRAGRSGDLLATADGCMAGVAVDWLCSSRWGLAARLNAHSYRLRSETLCVLKGGGEPFYTIFSGLAGESDISEAELSQAEGKAVFNSVRLGPTYAFDFARRFRFAADLGLGYATRSAYDAATLEAVRNRRTVAWGGGVSLTCLAAESLGVRLFADYTGTPASRATYTPCNGAIALGASVGVSF